MIQSFSNQGTEDIFNGLNTKEARKACPEILWKVATRKLDLLDSAEDIGDLCVTPGNQLERLSGNRKGQYSIRINDQYRICFVWTRTGAERVEIVDYH